MKKSLLFIALLILLANCKGSDIVKESELTFQIDEHSEKGTVIGKIDATASKGSLSFEVLTISVANAFTVSASGDILVEDGAKLDFEVSPKITATVKVKDDKSTSDVKITINLTDLKGPKKGLTAYYPFDGDSKDYSGNNRNATIHHNPNSGKGETPDVALGTDRKAKANSAYVFKGGAMSIPKFGETTEFSISVWVKASTGNSGNNTIIGKSKSDDANNRDLYLRLTPQPNNKIEFQYSYSSGYVTSQASYGVGTQNWVHIVYTYDNGKYALWEKGSRQVFTDGANPNRINWKGYDFTIGCLSIDSFTDQFFGSIDDLMFYNRALSSDEIKLMAEDKY